MQLSGKKFPNQVQGPRFNPQIEQNQNKCPLTTQTQKETRLRPEEQSWMGPSTDPPSCHHHKGEDAQKGSEGIFQSGLMGPFLLLPAGSPLGYLTLAVVLPSSLLWLLLCQLPLGQMDTTHRTLGPWPLPMALTRGSQTPEYQIQEKRSCLLE